MAISKSVVQILIDTLAETQTLLALIVNDPSDPTHTKKIACQFQYNNSILAAAKSWKGKNP